jgi:hypothetical protein
VIGDVNGAAVGGNPLAVGPGFVNDLRGAIAGHGERWRSPVGAGDGRNAQRGAVVKVDRPKFAICEIRFSHGGF